MSAAAAFPGMEAGRRSERVEWGLRATAETFLHRKGEVTPRISEEQALLCAGRSELGWRATEVVRRVVVTYTTAWERTGGNSHAQD